MAAKLSPQEHDDNQKMMKPWRPWIPSIDDLWDAYEKLKTNFDDGIYKGTTATLLDVLAFVSTWHVWKLPLVHKWLLCIFSIVLLGLRKMEHFYMLGCQKIPTWLKTKIDVLKIPVLLHKAQDLLEDILEKLENLPSSTEVEDVRSWVPTVPSVSDLKSAYGRIKCNFADGTTFLDGFKSTFNDATSILGSWNFWRSSIGQFILGFSLTLAEEGVLGMVKLYQWVLSKSPSISDYMMQLAGFIHDLRDKMVPEQLENGQQLVAQESNDSQIFDEDHEKSRADQEEEDLASEQDEQE